MTASREAPRDGGTVVSVQRPCGLVYFNTRSPAIEEVVGHLGNGASLEEVGHQGPDLRLSSLAALPVHPLLLGCGCNVTIQLLVLPPCLPHLLMPSLPYELYLFNCEPTETLSLKSLVSGYFIMVTEKELRWE